ncbi:MAG: Re/Si-specific NAD(P)(+) transhydrogenase subunit alpha [Casimicrobiaceae bacterium]|nr:Re/Si-specific NAD(P)(+) transhydrogenase subunit alpha [Casimicrobiaceae bacterium]MCX8098579.1 Re/Si-specific NAD(P)(+) transhydrogenase subunit alpha [Casimicrobiaceae bacterium]MDW8312690.1 Re/Si-specific NAD(P)(+) transhydrogenase subunit alpha [Burkholderiales bacterium]
MHIGIVAETFPGETRVAATPETVKKMAAISGVRVVVQSGAGRASGFVDEAYQQAGASLVGEARAVLETSDLVLKVRGPNAEELAALKPGSSLIGLLNPYDESGLAALKARGVRGFAMERIPRTTRAQSMDVLSSQANIAGYKAVILAAAHYPKLFPMLMTAAGTIKAARVVVLGVGVAGLQAIATAKRLGAVIEASDVRPAVKEQVESLGAKFIDVPYETEEERQIAEGVGGYARPMPESWMARQRVEVAKRVALADVVITTALIPGRPAPKLVTEEMVRSMKPGSVIVDLAAEQGGNCACTVKGEIVEAHGVKVIGLTNYPATVAQDASALYARNLLEFLKLLIDFKTGEFKINLEDDIVKAVLVTGEA